jgi:hypothetical protein
MNAPDLTPAEREDFHYLLRAGAERIIRRRRVRAQLIAGGCAVALVVAIAAGAIVAASGLAYRAPVAVSPSVTLAPSASSSPTASAPVLNTGSPAPSATLPVAPTPSVTSEPPEPEPEPITFTFECYVQSDEGVPSGDLTFFATMAEVWQWPDVSFCEATRHGDFVTAAQDAAVDLALPAYGGDRDYALKGLHVQCAMTDNGYLRLDRLTGNQAHEVRGMLALCPDRPGADKLAAALPPE